MTLEPFLDFLLNNLFVLLHPLLEKDILYKLTVHLRLNVRNEEPNFTRTELGGHRVVTLSASMSLSVISLSVPISPRLSVALSLCLSLCLSVSLSLCRSVALSRRLSLSLCFPVSLSPCLAVSLSLCFAVYLSR